MLKKKIVKYLFIFFATFSVLFSSISPLLKVAKAEWYQPGIFEFYRKVRSDPQDEIFGERYTWAQVNWIMQSLFWIPFSALTPDEIEAVLTGDASQESLTKLADSSFFGFFDKTINLFYQSMPASAVGSLALILREKGIVPTAYAQDTAGYGFRVLEPFRQVWKAVRDISYLCMTIVILVIAFSIMLRQRLNPQTVISIQSMLPKIVVTLLLITFSYAIAGFMVDMMYVFYSLIAYGLQTFGGFAGTQQTALKFVQDFNGGTAKLGILGILINGGWGIVKVSPATGLIGGILGIVGLILTGVFNVGGLIPILLAIVFAVIAYILRVIIMLAKSFLVLVLNIVGAPVILLLDLLPGNDAAIAWMRNIATQLLIFLAVGILLMLDIVLKQSIDGSSVYWTAPFLGNSKAAIKGIISLGVLGMLPEIDKIVNTFMQSKFPAIQPSLSQFAGISENISKGAQQAGTEFTRRYSGTPQGNVFGRIGQAFRGGGSNPGTPGASS